MALIVASEKQIAANRANGSRSCGPRSPQGKGRASHNSVRHGLTTRQSCAGYLAELDELAFRIAGPCANPMICEFARTAAEAELELARVRGVKTALIERSSVLGGLLPPEHFCSKMQEVRWCQEMDLWLRAIASHPAVKSDADG